MITLVPRDSLIGMVVGPAIWLGFFIAAYLVSGLGCSLGYHDASLAGMNAIQLLLILTGGLAAVLILMAGVQAELRRRHARAIAEQEEDPAPARRRFLYVTTLLLCAMSLVGTSWLMMTVIISPVC